MTYIDGDPTNGLHVSYEHAYLAAQAIGQGKHRLGQNESLIGFMPERSGKSMEALVAQTLVNPDKEYSRTEQLQGLTPLQEVLRALGHVTFKASSSLDLDLEFPDRHDQHTDNPVLSRAKGEISALDAQQDSRYQGWSREFAESLYRSNHDRLSLGPVAAEVCVDGLYLLANSGKIRRFLLPHRSLSVVNKGLDEVAALGAKETVKSYRTDSKQQLRALKESAEK